MKRGMLNAFPIGYATKLASETPGHEKAAYETFFLAFANPFVNGAACPSQQWMHQDYVWHCVDPVQANGWWSLRPVFARVESVSLER